jgi:hypothetical protein
VRLPLTKWDGGQVGKVFRNLHSWWPGDDPSKNDPDPTWAAIRKLQEGQDVRHSVTNLKRVLDALAGIHKQVSIGMPDITRLQAAVETFREAHLTFTDKDIFNLKEVLPFRYQLKLYDQVILCPVEPMSQDLLKLGLSLGVVSSPIPSLPEKRPQFCSSHLGNVVSRSKLLFLLQPNIQAHSNVVYGVLKCPLRAIRF